MQLKIHCDATADSLIVHILIDTIERKLNIITSYIWSQKLQPSSWTRLELCFWEQHRPNKEYCFY